MNFLTTNPFELLGTSISPLLLQSFVILMIALVVIGTLVDIIHKKNVKYFFENAKKAKKSATRELGSGERAAIIAKSVIYDVGTHLNLEQVKEEWLTYWVCMVPSYFG